MRVLYLDIDSQRPDHLGCYGYHRATSPNIDRVAAEGVRFDGVYCSDAPCLPSRSALFSGRFGIHTGVVGHGGTAADPFVEGAARGFGTLHGRTSWMRQLRDLGLYTVTVSPFAERHAAWHWYANFNEVHNPGRRGLERADEIAPIAIDWIDRRGADDDWFLHVNLWDPHTPYRHVDDLDGVFSGAPLPGWLTEEVRAEHWKGCGPHSAREAVGYAEAGDDYRRLYPKQPDVIDSMDAVRKMFDGYDAGVLHADRWFGEIMAALERAGVADDTAILISGDHGENLGELNVYGDHQTADEHTCRLPLILRWPGVTDSQRGRVEGGLHYQFDVAATLVELLGGTVPAIWDGRSFADALRRGEDGGRDALILSQGAWTCQRGVRFRDDEGDWLCLRSYHDGHHGYPDRMLFELGADPHEQRDLADDRPELCDRAMAILDRWHAEMMRSATHKIDPMWTVLDEGGPKHTKGELAAYLDRLRGSGRGHWADLLDAKHG